MRLASRAALALGAAATWVLVSFAPADAHGAVVKRGCGTVTVSLSHFRASWTAPNVVEVRRNGIRIDTVRFGAGGAVRTYPESATAPVTYEVVWHRTGLDRNTGGERVTLPLPASCPAASPTPAPSAGTAVPPAPSSTVAPAIAPGGAAEPPAPSPGSPSLLAQVAPYLAGVAAVWLPLAGALAAIALVRRRHTVSSDS